MSTDMKRTQFLASGLTIRQDFRDCVRMVFFDTEDETWQYATHGGTAFVVSFQGRPYAFTCRHVLRGFEWQQLVITDAKFGGSIAGLKSIAYASDAREGAIETDILDVAVVEFAPDVGINFFKDSAYLLDLATVATSRAGDALFAAGALKEKRNWRRQHFAGVWPA